MNDIIAAIDVTKCIDCRCCTVSCKDEFALNDYPPYSAGMTYRGHKWIRVENIERGTFPRVKLSSIPIMCMHCDDPPCMKVATGGAIYKRPDGIVIIDPVKSKGQRQIVNACPYGVIFWNEEQQIPQKCTFCVHRLEKGELPRCMAACAGEAIKIGERSALMYTQGQMWTEPKVLRPQLGVKPRVYYLGLPRAFITGAVVDSDTGDCLEGADITLKGPGGLTLKTRSDAFGDFWFDNLDAQTHEVDYHELGATLPAEAEHMYELVITKGTKSKTVQVPLVRSTNLGDITL